MDQRLRKIWVLIISSLGLSLVLCYSSKGQSPTLSLGIPTEHVGTPRSKPEPRKKLSKNPKELFNGTLQSDTQLRLDSLEELFAPSDQLEDFPEDFELRRIPDVQIRYLQLDDDPEPEVVIIAHLDFNKTQIAIADHAPDGWYRIGHFEYWYFAFPEDAEKAIEFHPPFILIRDTGGGSGYFRKDALVYRAWKEHLYKILKLTEEEEGGWQGINLQATIQFGGLPSKPLSSGIVVRTEKSKDYQDPKTGKDFHSHSRSCTGYEWVPANFSFEATARAKQELCK